MLTLDLEEDLGDEEMKLRRFDSSVRPNRQYIERMYQAYHKDKWGDQYGENLWKNLQERAMLENKPPNNNVISVGEVGGNHFVAIASPLHQRILRLCPDSCDILFVDSTGSVDENNLSPLPDSCKYTFRRVASWCHHHLFRRR